MSTLVSERATYATQPGPLRAQINSFLENASRPEVEGDILSVIVPGANSTAGAGVAAEVYNALQGRTYNTVILVAPSRAGEFGRMNICSVDRYWSPLGELRVNDLVRNELCDEDDDIYLDDRGHYHAGGVDVQLPYLQTVLQDFDVVPVVMGDESPEFCRELGTAIGEVMYNRRTLLVATADILAVDGEGLRELEEALRKQDVSSVMSLVNSETVRVEGKGPLLVAMIAALHRRADRATVLRTHAPVNGDSGSIGALFHRL